MGPKIGCRVRRFMAKACLRWISAAAFGVALAACTNNPQLAETKVAEKTASPFALPDWAKSSVGSKQPLLSQVAADELVGGDGRCGNAGPVAATVASAPSEEADANAGASPAAPPAEPSVIGGVGLGMSECDVARRAGAPDNVTIGSDEHGDRSVVLTYMRGTWPGIYRFSSGRLVFIERVAAPEPEKPKKVAKPAKASKPAAKAKAPAKLTIRPSQS